MIDWGFSADLGLDLPMPHPVQNIPALFFSAKTEALIEAHENIKALNNLDQVDPGMVTKMIKDQDHGDKYALWARNDYGVAEIGEDRPAATEFTIGDYDPTTVPGPEGENGSGFADITELPEDFTYTNDITSNIDGRKLGALTWYADGLSDWDSDAELERVKKYYEDEIGYGINDRNRVSKAFFTMHPNPAQNVVNLNSDSKLNRASIYDASGRLVNEINLNGSFNTTMDISTLTKGLFLIEVESTDGKVSVSKFIKK